MFSINKTLCIDNTKAMKPLRKTSERGNTIVEFALAWALIWSLFAGVYQVGYAFYVYNSLMVSVANAAELGSKLGYDTASPSAYTTALKNMVVYGDETAGTKSIVPNLAASNVNVAVTIDTGGMPRDVTVSITGYTINALFGSYSLSKPRATAMYYGQVSCSTC
jgi:Flp pilus assembly protein TadG